MHGRNRVVARCGAAGQFDLSGSMGPAGMQGQANVALYGLPFAVRFSFGPANMKPIRISISVTKNGAEVAKFESMRNTLTVEPGHELCSAAIAVLACDVLGMAI